MGIPNTYALVCTERVVKSYAVGSILPTIFLFLTQKGNNNHQI